MLREPQLRPCILLIIPRGAALEAGAGPDAAVGVGQQQRHHSVAAEHVAGHAADSESHDVVQGLENCIADTEADSK